MRVLQLLLAAFLVVALNGCSAPPGKLVDQTATAQAPLFANDDEAVLAAESAYRRYLEVSDRIANEGGINPERLQSLVSAQLYEESSNIFNHYESQGVKVEGSTYFDNLRVAGISKNIAEFYVCLDVSETKLISEELVDVTPRQRQNRIPLVIALSKNGEDLRIESSEVWSGRNYC